MEQPNFSEYAQHVRQIIEDNFDDDELYDWLYRALSQQSHLDDSYILFQPQEKRFHYVHVESTFFEDELPVYDGLPNNIIEVSSGDKREFDVNAAYRILDMYILQKQWHKAQYINDARAAMNFIINTVERIKKYIVDEVAKYSVKPQEYPEFSTPKILILSSLDSSSWVPFSIGEGHLAHASAYYLPEKCKEVTRLFTSGRGIWSVDENGVYRFAHRSSKRTFSNTDIEALSKEVIEFCAQGKLYEVNELVELGLLTEDNKFKVDLNDVIKALLEKLEVGKH